MNGRRSYMTAVRVASWLVVGSLSAVGMAAAADGNAKDKPAPGVMDQVGTAAKNAAAKLEQEVTGLAKKLQESETPKKVGNELKRSAESLGHKIEETGNKLKQSFKSE